MFSQQICSDVFTGSPWMSPLVKSLLNKKARSQKTAGRKLNDLTEKIGRIIAENRRGFWEAWIASLVEKIRTTDDA